MRKPIIWDVKGQQAYGAYLYSLNIQRANNGEPVFAPSGLSSGCYMMAFAGYEKGLEKHSLLENKK